MTARQAALVGFGSGVGGCPALIKGRITDHFGLDRNYFGPQGVFGVGLFELGCSPPPIFSVPGRRGDSNSSMQTVLGMMSTIFDVLESVNKDCSFT